MRIEDAHEGDAAAMAALSIEVWTGTYLRRGVGRLFAEYVLSEFTAERMGEAIADPAGAAIVARAEEGIAGYLRLAGGCPAPVPGPEPFEISTLYVQPRHHGGGVGRALLDAGLSRARAMGAGSVWLATNSENAPAIGFYLSQGFERAGRTAFELGGASYPNDVFVRRL